MDAILGSQVNLIANGSIADRLSDFVGGFEQVLHLLGVLPEFLQRYGQDSHTHLTQKSILCVINGKVRNTHKFSIWLIV